MNAPNRPFVRFMTGLSVLVILFHAGVASAMVGVVASGDWPAGWPDEIAPFVGELKCTTKIPRPVKPTPQTTPPASEARDHNPLTIDIEAMIDGKDYLVIRGNTVQWHHREWAAVGLHEGLNEPTIISTAKPGSATMDRVKWYPKWHDWRGKPVKTFQQSAMSSIFTRLTPVLPARNMTVTLHPLRCRSIVRIDQQPSADNNYTLVIEFNDQPAGHDWYTIRLTVADKHDLPEPPATRRPERSSRHATDKPVFLGPTPYRSFKDSPFNGLSLRYFHLEDFEDGGGRLNTPGAIVSGGGPDYAPPNNVNDSVDGDDGRIDGSGQGGRGYFCAGRRYLTFKFDQKILGSLPTHAGIVWTDVCHNPGPDGKSTVIFEAYDGDGVSLGQIGPLEIGDGKCCGETAEDRFFGATYSGGISAIKITMPESGDWEVDHLQYGGQ